MKGRRQRLHRLFAFLMAVLLCLTGLPVTSMTVYAEGEGAGSTTSGTWSENASEILSGAEGATAEAGTAENPYLITSAADLACLTVHYNTKSATEGKYFKIQLPNDATVLDMSVHYWVPIAKFAGNLDGNGVTVTGLKIGSSAETPETTGTYHGMFSELSAGAYIGNLALNVEIYTNSAEKDPSFVGGIAGMCLGTIDHCSVSGTIIAASTKKLYAGGIAGQLGDTTGAAALVKNSVNVADVTVKGASDKNTRGGGITGYMEGTATSSATIVNSANLGDVNVPSGKASGNNTQAGGLAGRVNYGTMHNCYNAGQVTLGSDLGPCVGMLAGAVINSVIASNCYYPEGKTACGGSPTKFGEAAISMADMAGSELLTALNANVTSLSTTYSGLLSWSMVNGNLVPGENTNPAPEESANPDPTNPPEETTSPAPTNPPAETESPAPTEPPAELPNDTWIAYAADNFESGDGSEATPYIIKTAEQLALLAKNAYLGETYVGKYFTIADEVTEIDLAAHEWTPIKAFAGVLDGNKAIVKNLNIGTVESNKDIERAGLFDTLAAGSAVKNLTVNASIYTNYTGTNYHLVGAVAAKTSGTVSNCTASGQINAQAAKSVFAGGVVGQTVIAGENVLVANCGNNVAVSGISSGGEARIGGVVGSVDERTTGQTKTVSVVNCYNTGTVTSAVTGGSSRPRSGGIAGWVREQNQTGVVWMYNCYNTGNMSVTSCANSDTKGTLGSVIGSLNSAWTGYSYLYSLENQEVANDYATVQKCSKEEMSLENMKAASFADTLNVNANNVVGEKSYTGILKWATVADGTPVFSDEIITGQAVSLSVSVNSERLGSVKIEADEQGGTSYTEVGTSALLEKNSAVKLTFTPTAGCKVSSVTVNGTAVENTADTYSFVLTEATVIAVTFEVVEAVNVNAIYVNPAASANGDGTETSPFQTLEQAKAEISSVLSTTPNANLTVYLMGGTYRLEETLALNEAHTSLGTVTFKNYSSDTPVITSGQEIPVGSFNKVDGKEYYAYQLTESQKTATGTYPEFRDLLVNGERATLARTEELTYKYTYANSVYGSATSSSTVTSCDNKLYVSAEALDGITDAELTSVELGQLVEWKSQIFHIDSRTGNVLDGTEAEITLNQAEWDIFYVTDTTKKSLVGRGYWLQNHLNFLDAPGEFYYDQANGIIYYYPYTDQVMSTATVEYATLDKLISMENAANIIFDGIAFTGTTANYITDNGLATQLGCTIRVVKSDAGSNVPCAAIYADMSENITVRNCTFEELSGTAMLFEYGIKNLTVTGNRIKDIGMAGVIVGVNQRIYNQENITGKPDKPGSSENVTISNNYITNVGMYVYGAPGIKVARSKDLSIQYNKIVHVPYSGIMTGYGWNVSETSEGANTNLLNADISYNYIEDYLFKINDGGAIYTCGANDFTTNTEYFNEIHHNYVRAGAHNKTYTAIYHDGSASNWHTHHNVVDDVKSEKGPMFFQDDVPTQHTHNILVENNYTTVMKITTSAAADRNIKLQNNTVAADRSQLSAEALEIFSGAGLQDAYKHLENPMDTEFRIANDTMHYVVEKGTTSQIKVELTNNSAIEKEFTISLTDDLPEYVTCEFAGTGTTVTLNKGETKILTATFRITDEEKFAKSDDFVVGFQVSDSTGRNVLYPRMFSVMAYVVDGTIAYATPTVDGIMDEAYLNSTKISYGEIMNAVIYNVAGSKTSVDLTKATSDLTGYAYLLWDDTNLYLYALVEESTVMSRGINYIQNLVNTNKPNNLWRTDSIEAYIDTDLAGTVGETKYAVDAFGIQRFGGSKLAFSEHNLPYATAFTYNGEIVEGLEIKEPTVGQAASTAEKPVNGYVVEMVLPLTKCTDLKKEGIPQVGDVISFRIQNNDFQNDGGEPGGAYIVSKAFDTKEYALMKVAEPTPTPTPTNVPTEAPTIAPTEAPTAKPTSAPTEAPTSAPTASPAPEDDNASDDEGNDDNSGDVADSDANADADSVGDVETPSTGDSTNAGLWLVVCMAACVVIAGILRKKSYKLK